MHQGKLVFAQLMLYLPLSTFRRCVADHRGEHKVKDFSCLDQFFAMAFAQLTYRESLRDIEVNLRAQARRLYHMGFRCQTISRNTLANANATRPWQIYADFAQHLIGLARPLYAKEPFGLELDAAVYAFDASTIELRPSKGGKYLGVTITVTATSREQLDELYRTLSTHPMVKVVL